MVAGSTFGKNPIIHAVRRNLANCEDLLPARLHETPVNEPLINWHAIDGDLALEAIRASGGYAGNASDKSMSQYARILREKEGLSVLPASTAGLISLLDLHRQERLPGDRYVVILTGKKA
jgi:threonine synthase